MQLTGMPPSAESMSTLYPIQETWCPFCVALAAHIAGLRQRRQHSGKRPRPLALKAAWLPGPLLPPRARARLRSGFGVSGGLGADFSRASIAVASREMCATR